MKILLNFVDGTTATVEVEDTHPLAESDSWSVHMDHEPHPQDDCGCEDSYCDTCNPDHPPMNRKGTTT
jgi:hypothetical protein